MIVSAYDRSIDRSSSLLSLSDPSVSVSLPNERTNERTSPPWTEAAVNDRRNDTKNNVEGPLPLPALHNSRSLDSARSLSLPNNSARPRPSPRLHRRLNRNLDSFYLTFRLGKHSGRDPTYLEVKADDGGGWDGGRREEKNASLPSIRSIRRKMYRAPRSFLSLDPSFVGS